jgi:methyl-accepting chemotaxis protein
MWKSFKVRTKIIFTFAVPLTLIAGIAVWTFQVGKGISKGTKTIKNKSVKFALLAEKMSKDVIQIQQWLTDISATRGLDGLDDGFEEAEKSYRSFLNGLALFKKLYVNEDNSAGVQKVQELRKRLDEYYEMGKRMAKSYVEGGPNAGNKMMEKFDETAKNLTEVLEPFVKDQLDGMDKKLGVIVQSVTSLKTGMMVVSLVSILFVIVSGIFLTRSINIPLKKGVIVANYLSNGVLNMKIGVDREDEFGQLLVAMKRMVENLRQIAGKIASATNTVASGSEEVSSITTQITSGIEQQFQQIEQSATATTEISQTILDVTKNASNASGAARESVEVATEGKKVVEQTVSSMLSISQAIETSARTIEELGKSSRQIGEIINVINDIADQTNLLALNAAIEAARAGEQGRGFAVVADEVRKLAERTGRATEEISEMIRKIQQDTEVSVKSMEGSKVKAEDGVKLAEKSRESLEKIVHASERCLAMIQSIATATEEQTVAIEQVAANMENIADVSKTSQDAISQINTATNGLARLSNELRTLVAWFKVDSSVDNNMGNSNIMESCENNYFEHSVCLSHGNGDSFGPLHIG